MVAERLHQEYGRVVFRWAALAGYAAGLVVTVMVATVFHAPQPATLFLFPGVLGGLAVALWRARLPVAAIKDH